MIFSRWTFLGKSKRILEDITPKAKQIQQLSESYKDLSNRELKEIMARNRRLIQSGSMSVDDAIIEVYACIIEASSRILNKRHFFQQILGGMVVHSGRIAELKTGEGKTLMSTLPIILNALTGYGVHVVTVNDYLAERDCKLNKPLYEFFDLTSGYITNDTESSDKKEIYDMDITYCTASRMAFDFLESHMASSYEEKYRFSCKFMCVDECDYLLIDEAKVPLIISSQSNEDNEMYVKFNPVITTLKINDDFTINLKGKTAWLTPTGFDKVEKFARDNGIIVGGLFSAANIDYFHIVSNLLRAHFVMIQNKDYVVHEGKVVIIDEATGRLAVGKKYSHGIHQAIEAKEGVDISKSTTISASITYPNFFRMYEKIGGMTGTGMTEANELKEVYNLDVVQIPTHKPIQRIDDPYARLYKIKNDMFEDIAKLVFETNKTGQPILIGTESVLASETLSSILSKYHIKHSVLNAKNHKEEASIIAQAGKKYAVTISTNMAGRGVDIALGGNPEEAAKDLAEREHEDPELVLRILREKVARERQEVMNLGGLLVIVAGTLNNKKDEQQLAGRSGRQGNPGRSIRFSSLEDSVMSEDNKIMQWFIDATCALDEEASAMNDIGNNASMITHDGGRYICSGTANKIIDAVQQGKQDASCETRKHLLKFDNTIHKQRVVIYELRDYILLTTKIVGLVIAFGRSLIDKIYDEYKSHSYEKFVNQVNIIFQESFVYNDKLLDIKNKVSDKIYNVLIHKDQEEIRKHIVKTFDRCFKSIINKYEDLKRTIFIANYNQDDPYIKYAEIAYKMFMDCVKEIEMDVMQIVVSGRAQSNDSLFDFDFGDIFSKSDNEMNMENPLDSIFSRMKKGGMFGDTKNNDDMMNIFGDINKKNIFDEDDEIIEEEEINENETLRIKDEDKFNRYQFFSNFNKFENNDNVDEKINTDNTNEEEDYFTQLAKKNKEKQKEIKNQDEIFAKANESLNKFINSLMSGEIDEQMIKYDEEVENGFKDVVVEEESVLSNGLKIKRKYEVQEPIQTGVLKEVTNKKTGTKAVKDMEDNHEVTVKKIRSKLSDAVKAEKKVVKKVKEDLNVNDKVTGVTKKNKVVKKIQQDENSINNPEETTNVKNNKVNNVDKKTSKELSKKVDKGQVTDQAKDASKKSEKSKVKATGQKKSQKVDKTVK